MTDSSLPVSKAIQGAAIEAPDPQPSTNRIIVLDGIRGIAVLFVMMFHFWIVAVSSGPLLWERVYDSLAGMGWIGVDLFFVLSGFLITGILYDSRDSSHYFRIFYGRRTVRIFPLYYAALIIFFLVGPFVLAHVHRSALADLQSGANVKLFAWTYLLNWYEGLKGWDAVAHPLQHFWSLSVEEQFYLIWPFLVLKLARRQQMSVCAGLIALALTLRGVMYELHLPIASYLFTVCRMDSLAIGAIVALAARDSGDWKVLLKWARRLALPLLGAVVLGRILNPNCTVGPGDTPTFFMNTFELTLVGSFFAACIAMAIASEQRSFGHRLLASRFLRFLGKYSYCLYICHLPVIVIFARAGLNTVQLMGKVHSELLSVVVVNGVAFGVSVAISFASWHLYEKQWLKLKHLPALRRDERLSAKSA
jgi:peptidoglycan/LPS O-acetylase OafA/YrhL